MLVVFGFRDGVRESQFNQVLNIELDQIIKAYKFLDENWHSRLYCTEKSSHQILSEEIS
ncbi:hypothetical protein MKW94_002507 [Papaver nudicaule]|uniref:Piwi domain-containing protein n=1 Tax=Papaver nudicaule TaxID=74823 RepID=A0AA41VHD8_PAPNU|nr:hypothetical protein [Papaver nudicaule]